MTDMRPLRVEHVKRQAMRYLDPDMFFVDDAECQAALQRAAEIEVFVADKT